MKKSFLLSCVGIDEVVLQEKEIEGYDNILDIEKEIEYTRELLNQVSCDIDNFCYSISYLCKPFELGY